MKNLFRFICVALLAVVFAACSGGGPEGVAVDFTKALYTGNAEKATSYCTDETKSIVDMIMGFSSSKISEMKKTSPDVRSLGSELSEDGNSATVKIEIKDFYDVQEGTVIEEAKEEEIDLKKINGEWKVALKK